MNANRVQTQFVEAMKMNGVGPSNRRTIIADGKLHRYHVVGDKASQKNGWYVLFADGVAAGAYGSHRLGKKFKWCARKSSSLSPIEHKKLNARHHEIHRLRDEKIAAKQKRARSKVIEEWNAAKRADPMHGYLKRKKVNAHGLRQVGDQLLVPLRDAAGKLWSTETIGSDGTKMYFKGARKSGCFHVIGGPIRFESIIAEGYATAATCFEVMGIPAVMAGDCGNLLSVATEIRKKYPLIEIYMAADNNWANARKDGVNIGLEKASRAASAVNGRVAIPVFDQSGSGDDAADFNDLLRLRGKSAVRKSFANARTVVPVGGNEAFAMSVHDFLRLPIKPRKALAAPWLREGGLALIHAAPGVGKTFLRDGLAAHFMVGKDFLRWSIKRPASVLIVDGEMPAADVQERIDMAIKAIGGKPKAPMRIVAADTLRGSIDLSDPKWRDTIEREGAGSQVIFLDNVAALMGDAADMNDAKPWLGVQRWMVQMRAKGHAIVWFHHDGKNGSQLGTVAREFVLDARIQLTNNVSKKLAGTAFKITYRKKRKFYGIDAQPFSVKLETRDGKQTWTCEGSSEEKRVAVLRLHKQGKSEREIASTTKVPKSTVNRWINEPVVVKSK